MRKREAAWRVVVVVARLVDMLGLRLLTGRLVP
jgi:hypothetical protein